MNLGLHQPDVSVIWDLGPHDFSILRYWLGEARSRLRDEPRLHDADSPDVAFVNLGFPVGTIANVELSWLAPSKLRRTTIVGSRKMVVYDDTSREPCGSSTPARAPGPGDLRRVPAHLPHGRDLSPPIEAAEPLAIELRDFCRAIRDHVEPSRPRRSGSTSSR